VGIGTLYRHFATREELIDELAHRSFERLLDHLARAEEGGGTAVDVLRRFLLDVVDDRDRLVLPSTSGPRVAGPRARALQRRLHAGLRDLLARGHEDGTVLREVDVWDVAWLGATLSAPAPGTRGWRTTAARLLDTYLDGLGVRRIDP
jgi:AcrR family transcriptional regulator